MTAPFHVISGGGSGIGAALARHAALELEATVAVIDRSEARANEVSESIRSQGGVAVAVVADVSQYSEVAAASAELLAAFGAPSLLACNAGIEYAGPLWEMDPLDWHRIQSVNVDGAFTLTRAFLPAMIEARAPAHLLYTASVGAVTITENQAAYVTSKHALRALAQSVARDLEDREIPIGVSILMPAAVSTRIFQDSTSSGSTHADSYRTRLETMLRESGQSPEEVARITYAAIHNQERWIYPDRLRGETLLRAFSADLLSAFDSAPSLRGE